MEYFEFEAHPAPNLGYTLAERQHRIKIIGRLISRPLNEDGNENQIISEIRSMVVGLRR